MVRHSQQPPAVFVADAPALDFLNTTAGEAHDGRDWLDSGEGLAEWLEQAKLVPHSVLETTSKAALPGEMDKLAEQARDLRVWFDGFVHNNMGRPLQPGAFGELGPLNRLLETGESYIQLVDGGERDGAPRARALQRWRTPTSLLLPVGETIARFVCEENFSRVRVCEGHGCQLVFLDRTRGGLRRWCNMSVCGNRAKAQAHRDRARPPPIAAGGPATDSTT